MSTSRGEPDPRRMSTAQITRCYHEKEDFAKQALQNLKTAQSQGRQSQMTAYLGQTYRQAGSAMRFRMALRQYQLLPDVNHDQAIHWIYNNIVQVAYNIQRQNGIFTEEPKPTDPLATSSNRSGNSGQTSRGEISAEPDVFLLNRTGWLDLRKQNYAYFIYDCLCMLVKYTVGSTDDIVVEIPRLLTDKWSCLAEAGFFTADAVLPVPSSPAEAYFFYRTQYVRINMASDRIVSGPHIIADEWPSLKSSNFLSINAVLPIVTLSSTDERYELAAENEAYFFYGKSYALIKVNPGTNNDEVINGPKFITTEWPSLRQSGFVTVDSTVMIPKDDPEAYFFNGANYCRITIARGSNDDSIVGGKQAVWKYWPSLADEFFY
ncbi:hypothetical protein Hte_007332 [Hypoxylon texense]